ncbi:MAG: hypothetical protein IJW70_08165 [Clostridia bacterium]|nr:hypothetical protein [Clostridia bacterium]
MRTRFICLTLCMLMLLSVLLTGCNQDKDVADVEQISGITLTMWVISDKEVANTDAEMAELKAELLEKHGQGAAYDQAVAEAEATRAAYEEVEAEITKITKSKFKVNLDLYFYTEEQYYGEQEFDREEYEDLKMNATDEEVEAYLKKCGKLIYTNIQNEEYQALKEKAAKALKKYLKDAKAEGRVDTDKLREEFYAKNPQYAEFANVSDDEEEETEIVEEVTSYNEYEIAEIVYPELEKHQIDIIYLSGFDRYNEFINNEWVQPLDEEISGASRKLTDYISATLLGGVQIEGSTYAIPNNVSIGEYTYLTIDKELFDKYYYNITDIEDVLDCRYFLADIVKYEEGVLPLDATYEECMSMLVWYWSMTYEEQEKTEEDEDVDIGDIGDSEGDKEEEPAVLYDYYYDKEGDQFSMFGTVYGSAANRNRGSIRLQFSNLFTKTDYLNILRELMTFKFEGYFGEAAEGQTVAVDFVKGNSDIKKAMEKDGYFTAENGRKYYAVIAEYPEATENELYGNMFAVSAYSHFAVGRSMDIITYLNTNSTIRNLLQYGIEGKNYELSEPSEGEVLTILNDSYQMSIEKTGNVFMAHPGEGKRADAWEGAREQNNESLIDPLLGFDFNTVLDGDETGLDIDPKYSDAKAKDDPDYQPKGLIDKMTVKSADIQARLDACTNINELNELIEALKEELKESTKDNAWIKKANNPAYDPDAATATLEDEDASNDDFSKGHSPYTIYVNWLTEYGYDVAAQ